MAVPTGDGVAVSGTCDGSSPPDVPPTARIGVLLVRAWVDPDRPDVVKARLLTTEDDGPLPAVWATAAGSDAIGKEFLRWLEHVLAPAGPPEDASPASPSDATRDGRQHPAP